jgi:hypothetical protein
VRPDFRSILWHIVAPAGLRGVWKARQEFGSDTAHRGRRIESGGRRAVVVRGAVDPVNRAGLDRRRIGILKSRRS